jgi:pyruvate dehydrogenase E1 component beta subunit
MGAIKYSDALREAIREEMIKDENVILIGEEVGQGYRGCFGVSTGLYEEFGPDRIIDTPISENSIMGLGIGTALMGMKPIVEIMFSDFVAVCFDGVLNQISKIKFMSGDQFSNLNFVLRLPGGAGNGTGPHHSQCLESIFMSIPGLDIAVPSNTYDAKGLLKSSINRGNPVVFFEHKKLYKTEGNVPEKEYSIPFGKGVVVRDGKDLTIVATSYMVKVAEEVADEMKRNSGIEIEIIDPRTLVPLDIEIIGNSVKKTSKLLVLEEGNERSGVAAEISYRVNEEYSDYLDYPIKRIGSKNSPIPMTPNLEKVIIPNKDSVVSEIGKYFEI